MKVCGVFLGIVNIVLLVEGISSVDDLRGNWLFFWV